MSKKAGKITLLIVGGILLSLALIGLYADLLLKQALPPLEGSLSFKNLQNPVKVYRDSMGIPQIVAENDHDAYFALGFLHASDRLFQIDLTRRVAEGRLSQLFGKLTLNLDRHQRLLGHYRLAQKFVPQLSAQDKEKLQAYVDGLNTYVASCRTLPFEYHLLNTNFEPYTIKDLLSVLSFQTWFSNALLSSDEWLAKVFDRFGADTAASLARPYPVWAPFTVPQEPAEAAGFATLIYRSYFGQGQLPLRMAHSSNAWVIGPKRSQSGYAMLASDPHLETRRLPQFWYMVGLHIRKPQINVLGITTPGLPFVVMGHNGHAAWAFTVGGIDVNEVYREKINPQDSTQYLTAHGWQKFKVIEEAIPMKGQKKPFLFRMRFTQDGPVVWSTDSMRYDYALHWAGFDMNLAQTVHAAFKLHQIDNFDEFRKTVTKFGALDANWMYADREGNIGYQLGTPIPIRARSVYKLPVPGWIDSLKWHGFHALDETPHSYNPRRGWLATSNNKPDARHLSYPLFGKFAADRILRITELLKSQPVFSLDDIKRFQMDRTDRFLQHWQPILVGLLKERGQAQLAKMIESWQGNANAKSKSAALIILFKNRLRHLIFDDQLGKMADKISDEDLLTVFNHGPAFWFDNIKTPKRVEQKHEVALKAVDEALKLWQGQSWGALQSFSMAHPMAKIPVIGSLLGLKKGPFPWGGTPGTLNASFYEEDKQHPGHFKSIVGPSWRFVIDFSNPDAAEFVLPAGESGDPKSPFFMNFFDFWKSGKRWQVPISIKKIVQRAKYRLILLPEKKSKK